jgi:hypothetical protein
MNLNERIKEKYEVITDSSIDHILSSIELKRKEQSLPDFLEADSIDYEEIRLTNKRIEIIRSPGLLKAFRPPGKITIDMKSGEESKTILSCEILPYNGHFPLYLGLLMAVLFSWSLLVLLFGLNLNAILIILSAGVGFGTAGYISYRITKWQLLDYSRRVIHTLTQKEKKTLQS